MPRDPFRGRGERWTLGGWLLRRPWLGVALAGLPLTGLHLGLWLTGHTTLGQALVGILWLWGGCLTGFGLGAGFAWAVLRHHARRDLARRDGGSGGGRITGRD